VTPAERAALRLDWLTGTTAEIERRRAATLEAAGDERERFINTLQEMAQRLAATAHLYPIDTADMSIAEKLAILYFWPENQHPEGLGSEKQIWAEYAARK
jgi:hypothetical protein